MDLGADSLPIVFVVLAYLFVQFGRYIFQEWQRDHAEDIEQVQTFAELKDEINRCREAGREWKRKYEQMVKVAQYYYHKHKECQDQLDTLHDPPPDSQ